MKRRNVLAVLGLGVLSVYGACRAFHHDDDTIANRDLLRNRFWIEKSPEKRTDHVHGFFMIKGRDTGLFSRSSLYDLHLEVFNVEQSDKELKLHFPQTDKRTAVGYTVKACDDKKGFDLCLDLSENPWGGPKRYYSKKTKKKSDELDDQMADAVERAADVAE